MTYYLIAGEASGDLHASNLIKALKQEDHSATFRCWGGDLMQKAGAKLDKHYRALAFMGIWEVLKNLKTISKNFQLCKENILDYQPDALILIDYSGFNLRMAKWAKSHSFRVYYYISPQVWATRSSRVYKIKKWVDRMFVILPFEQAFYQRFGVEVDFVGHPLLDAIAQHEFADDFIEKHQIKKPIIALLPGSRKQEISAILGLMLQLVDQFAKYQFIIAVAPAIPISFYQNILQKQQVESSNIILLQQQTYDLLKQAKAAIVTSGTATLETALIETPQVVCYKGSWLTYQIAKRLIKVPYISLVNLIAEQAIIKELIQDEMTVSNLERALQQILEPETQIQMKEAYQAIKKKLGGKGSSLRTAKLIVEDLVLNHKRHKNS